jgi:hypothetical protein
MGEPDPRLVAVLAPILAARDCDRARIDHDVIVEDVLTGDATRCVQVTARQRPQLGTVTITVSAPG